MKTISYSKGQIKRYLNAVLEQYKNTTEIEVRGKSSSFDVLLDDSTYVELVQSIHRRNGEQVALTGVVYSLICSAIKDNDNPLDLIAFLNNNVCPFKGIESLIQQLRRSNHLGMIQYLLSDLMSHFEAKNIAKEIMGHSGTKVLSAI